MSKQFNKLLVIMALFSLVLSACASPASPAAVADTPAPAATAAPAAIAAPTEVPAVTNDLGVELAEDAAPLDQQNLRFAGIEGKHFDTMRAEYEGFAYESTIETLAMMDADGVWHPAAADSWEVSDGGRTWTFKLRQDAKWSDGTPITAEDWVYSYQRYADPAMANGYAFFIFDIENAEAVNKGEMPLDKLGVKKIDDYTFSVTTKVSLPYYMFNLNWHVAPVPKHMVEKHGNAWADSPETAPSSGPFMIKEWNRGNNVIFTLNPFYTGRWKPKINQMTQVIIPQGFDQMLEMYQAGDVDTIGGIRGDQLAQVLAFPSLRSQSYVSTDPRTAYLYMNMGKAPFDNLKVRQAFMHSVDRESLCNGVMRGTCIPGYGLLPTDFPCTNNDNEALRAVQSFDPAMAKKLMEEAGYPGGVGFPELVLNTRAGEFAREAEAVQKMLIENLGITVTIQDIERATYSDLRSQGKLIFGFGRWGADFIDPSNFFDWWDDPDFNSFVNPEFTRLIDEARPMTDAVKRCETYRQAEMILASEGPATFLLYPKIASLYKAYIKGIPLSETGTLGNRNDFVGRSIYVTQH